MLFQQLRPSFFHPLQTICVDISLLRSVVFACKTSCRILPDWNGWDDMFFLSFELSFTIHSHFCFLESLLSLLQFFLESLMKRGFRVVLPHLPRLQGDPWSKRCCVWICWFAAFYIVLVFIFYTTEITCLEPRICIPVIGIGSGLVSLPLGGVFAEGVSAPFRSRSSAVVAVHSVDEVVVSMLDIVEFFLSVILEVSANGLSLCLLHLLYKSLGFIPIVVSGVRLGWSVGDAPHLPHVLFEGLTRHLANGSLSRTDSLCFCARLLFKARNGVWGLGFGVWGLGFGVW